MGFDKVASNQWQKSKIFYKVYALYWKDEKIIIEIAYLFAVSVDIKRIKNTATNQSFEIRWNDSYFCNRNVTKHNL